MRTHFPLKKILLTLTALTAAALSPVHATEMARVVNKVVLQEQVAVPRRVCRDEAVTTPGRTSGAGAALGAVAGGAVGNQIGGGNGRAAATAIGLIGGAMLGNSIESPGTARTEVVQRCTNESVVETRVRGYQVTYEYAGKSYQVEMPYDPGNSLAIQITPVINGPQPVGAAYPPAPQPMPSSHYPTYR